MVVTYKGFVFRENSEKSQRILDRDYGSVSTSYTRSYGFVMDHGKGSEVWDVDGYRYLDFAAGIAVLSTGHCHPKVVAAIQDQTAKYIHIGATDFFCPQQVKAAENLQRIVPINKAPDLQDKRVYLCNSGTESIEAALKLARYQPGNRHHIIGFYGSFHGRTMGSLSITASKNLQRAGYPHLPGGVDHVPYPSKFESEHGSNFLRSYDPIEYTQHYIVDRKVPANEIAAVVVEPIQGEGGYVVPTDDFFPRLRKFCDKNGILLIADEVQSGVGRTGKWYALEHWGVEADIVCTAKGIGSGFPVGAIVTHRDIMEAWVPGAHASTYGGNPVACAAVNATINVIEQEGLLESVTALGDYTVDRLKKFQEDHPSIRRLDGKGMMLGVEFSDSTGKLDPVFRDHVVNECFLSGLLTLACGKSGLRIAPPLVIRKEQIIEGLDILEYAIAKVEEEYYA